MQYTISIAKKLRVPADVAWRAVLGIGRIDVWFPGIATCQVDGEGVGASRYMTTEDGGEITDQIKEIDLAGQRLTYQRVKSPFPVSSYLGTVEVFRSNDSMAVIVWTVVYESRPEVGEAFGKALQAGIGAGVDGMERDLNGWSAA
jgi:hypothetical protein